MRYSIEYSSSKKLDSHSPKYVVPKQLPDRRRSINVMVSVSIVEEVPVVILKKCCIINFIVWRVYDVTI